MRMTGEQHIAVERGRLWSALNDPEVLRRCLPGCQSLVKEAQDRFTAVMEVRIGPIGARFKGDVTLSDAVPDEGYRLAGQGQGGIAGSAKGSARMRLSDAPGGTLLTYEVEAEVGGRMAQLGGPIIDATAKQLAGAFFSRLSDAMAGEAAPSALPRVGATGAVPQVPSRTSFPWSWTLALAAAVLAGFLLGRSTMAGGWALAVALLAVLAAGAGYEAGRRRT